MMPSNGDYVKKKGFHLITIKRGLIVLLLIHHSTHLDKLSGNFTYIRDIQHQLVCSLDTHQYDFQELYFVSSIFMYNVNHLDYVCLIVLDYAHWLIFLVSVASNQKITYS